VRAPSLGVGFDGVEVRLPTGSQDVLQKGKRELASERAKVREGRSKSRRWWREVPGTFQRRRGRWIWPSPSPWPPLRARGSCLRKCCGGEKGRRRGWTGDAGLRDRRRHQRGRAWARALGFVALWPVLRFRAGLSDESFNFTNPKTNTLSDGKKC
jgi:hypothetical protein